MDKKPRLIDADALKCAMEEMLMSGKDAVEAAYINEVAQIVIDESPTIEAEPVRRGRWIMVRDRFNNFPLGQKCSECGRRVKNDGENYCPKCGAKMDGGKENDRE